MIKTLILLDKNIETQNKLFHFISLYLEEKNIIKPSYANEVVKAFKNREKESSTAFEEGFAIPHAVSEFILEPTILYIRLKNGINANSLDGKPSKYFICLFIPLKDRSSKHMNILSSIATGLLNVDFKKILETSFSIDEITNTFENIVHQKNNIINNNLSNSEKILAITACPVGVAHTYLAAERIQLAANDLNYKCKVETHGSVGIKNQFSEEDIKEADLIIIASDIGIDTSRFVGKKIYQTSIKPAIIDSKKLIEDAFINATNLENDLEKELTKPKETEKKSFFIKHLLSGVSYMIPFIIFGGLLIAISLGIGKAIYSSGDIPTNSFLFYLLKAGEVAFTLMIPILGGFIANSIAGRAAIAPAMIVSFVANTPLFIYQLPGIQEQTPLGFIGAILFGVIIGWTVKWMNTWKIHKNIASMMPIFIIPLAVTLFFSLISIFVISAPVSYVMNQFGKVIANAFINSNNSNIGIQIGIGIGMGLLIGTMAGFDMGGPVNKIAFITCSSLLTINIILPDGSSQLGIGNPMGMMAAAIPIAPIGMGLSTIIHKKYFSQEQKSLGISAIVMGFIGISEGAIPFAVSDPKRVIISNVIGSATAGAIAGALGVTCGVSHGGPIVGVLGAVSGNFIGSDPTLQLGLGILFFFIAILSGVIVTVIVYGLLLKFVKNEKKSKQEKNNIFLKFSDILKNIFSRIHNFFNDTKSSIWIKNNKTKFAWITLLFLAVTTFILGIVLFSISLANNELQNFIDQINNNTNASFPLMSSYGLFLLVNSLILVIGTIFYAFTVFEKKKEALNI
ncbi:MAG: fructose-specific PTS transporter subunit EIIC [Metamycoplasmataceae bacterium]